MEGLRRKQPDQVAGIALGASQPTEDSALLSLEQQLLAISIYAGALRAQIAQPGVQAEQHSRDLLHELESTRRELEDQVNALRFGRTRWWRRWLGRPRSAG